MGQATKAYYLWQEELDELISEHYCGSYLDDDRESYIELFEEGLTPEQAFNELDLPQTDLEFYLEHYRL